MTASLCQSQHAASPTCTRNWHIYNSSVWSNKKLYCVPYGRTSWHQILLYWHTFLCLNTLILTVPTGYQSARVLWSLCVSEAGEKYIHTFLTETEIQPLISHSVPLRSPPSKHLEWKHGRHFIQECCNYFLNEKESPGKDHLKNDKQNARELSLCAA